MVLVVIGLCMNIALTRENVKLNLVLRWKLFKVTNHMHGFISTPTSNLIIYNYIILKPNAFFFGFKSCRMLIHFAVCLRRVWMLQRRPLEYIMRQQSVITHQVWTFIQREEGVVKIWRLVIIQHQWLHLPLISTMDHLIM